MRYRVGAICVPAPGLIGCSETSLNVCEGVDCDDDNECTDDVCDLTTGMCINRPLEDGTDCGDGAGTCQAGSCTFARTEQGIRGGSTRYPSNRAPTSASDFPITGRDTATVLRFPVE